MPRAVPATIFVTLLIVVLGLAAWQLSFVLLLTFAGALLAVFLRHMAMALAGRLPISPGAALAIVLLVLAAILVLGVVSVGPQLLAQLDLLIRSFPAAMAEVQEMLEGWAWGRFLLERVPSAEDRPEWNVFGTITGTVSTAAAVVANVVVVISVAIFLANDPGLYRRGILTLVPRDKRGRAGEVLDALSDGLWRWLVGQGLAMLTVAVTSALGLWLIGVPLALTLGVIAGLLDFIPYVGPFLGAAPAVMFALAEGPTEALWTVALFVVIQQIEGNVLMPVIQSRASSLPPALTILAVIGFGVLFGFMGVFLATPLLLVTIVLVRMLYVEDVLGDHAASPPEREGHERAGHEQAGSGAPSSRSA